MKAPPFEYHRPDTVPEVLALLADPDAGRELLAGGQSLVPMMNFRIAAPEALIDLNRVEGLDGVVENGDWIEIGAMTRYRTLERSEVIAARLPLMARALPHIAHPAIRARGTIGGSVALADPAAEMPAILLASAAEVRLRSASGGRQVPADGFFHGLYETARAEDELITGIRVPVTPNGWRHGFYEIVRRHGDYAMAGCAISASGDLEQVRIAFFGVAQCACRVSGAEAALVAGQGSAGALDGAVAALGEIEFEGDVHASAETKRHLAGVALSRAWAEVTS